MKALVAIQDPLVKERRPRETTACPPLALLTSYVPLLYEFRGVIGPVILSMGGRGGFADLP